LDDSDFLSIRDYASAIWRWKWFVVAVVLAAAAAGFLYARRQPHQYKSTATLMYQTPVDPANPLANSYVDPSVREAVLSSAGGVLASPAIQAAAEKAVGQETAPYTVSSEVATGVSTGGTSSGNSNLVLLSVVSTNPSESALLTNAYATALTDWSREQQLARIAQAEQATKERMGGFTPEQSRQGTEYLLLKNQLLQLEILKNLATGDLRVVVPAVEPTRPFSPQPLRSAALSFSVGLVLSLGVAMLAAQWTTRIRSRQEAANALGLPVLGVLPRVGRRFSEGGKLVALEDRTGSYAEALRFLRTTLDYKGGEPVSSLLITSSASGEGKTLFACNLAVTLTMAGKKVILVDADLREPRVHEHLSLANNVGVSSIVTRRCQVGDALQRVEIPVSLDTVPVRSGPKAESTSLGAALRLHVLTSGPIATNPGELVASERFAELIRTLDQSPGDIVIVDSPPLTMVGDAAAIAASVSALVFVVDPRRVRRPALAAAKGILDSLPCRALGIVLVGVNQKKARYY
jgi:Mrp family chromosome partitioning ATPase/capsular polysaccharide biosynthesis protein